MKVNSTFIQISTEDPGKMFAFYRDVVGLEVEPNAGEFTVKANEGTMIGFDAHDQVKGATKEPARVLVDLFVDDVKGERERMEGAGVKFIRKEGREPWGGVISTFIDPDGNYGQIIEYKPE